KANDHQRPEYEKKICPLTGGENQQLTPPRDLSYRLGKKHAPGKQPENQKSPKKQERDGVVAGRHAFVQITQEMFIDEIEPEEPAGCSLIRITQRRQNMPRSCDRKKDEGAGEKPHA